MLTIVETRGQGKLMHELNETQASYFPIRFQSFNSIKINEITNRNRSYAKNKGNATTQAKEESTLQTLKAVPPSLY